MVTSRVRQPAGLLDLAAHLIGELTRLVHQRLDLLKIELKQEATEVAKCLALVAAGVGGVSAGLLLLVIAVGLWVGGLVGSTAGGLAIVGGGLLLVGAGLGVFGARSLGRRRLIPGTIRELQRDAEWIEREA